jgi:predicted  nucleic acid-binding Zn-ribbon protein
VDINTNVVRNYQTAEYGKFVELKSTNYPAVSVVRLSYPDTSSAFPSNSATVPLSSVDIYPKYAVLSYIANPGDISLSLSLSSLNLSGISVDVEDLENAANTINANTSATNDVLRSINSTTSATNTRLENIDTDLDTTNTRLQTLITQTDQLEPRVLNIQNNTGALNIAATEIITLLNDLTGKQTTINLDVSAINLNTDEIETKLDDVNTKLDTLDSNTNAVEGLISGVLSNTDNLETQIDTTNSRLQTILAQTYVGTTSDQPLFVNPGALMDTVDSVSIDKSISQTVTRALTSRVFVSGPRKVYNVFGISTSDSNQYIQLYNTGNTAPSGTPIGVFFVPANSNFSFDINRGLNFTTNVLVVNSVTPVVYTQGNDDLFMTVIHN